MSGGIRTSVKGYLNAQRTSLALDPVHENVTINSNVTTAQDPVEETTMDSTKYGLSICDGNIPCFPVLTAKNLASHGTRNTESPPQKGSGGSGSKNHFPYIVIIAVSTIVVICGLLFAGYRHYQRKRNAQQSPEDTSTDNNFLEKLIGMPIRYRYKDLKTATNNFSNKIGEGGFGSVYLGVLPDGTRLAVKMLKAHTRQGERDFQAEVGISGSIHHWHLVRLRGFCAKGSNRLLAYEYMANGSLDKWIFGEKNEDFVLDWETRFNIAVGIAKGLAHLHEDCDLKIIHRDIKPHNVLLDDNYNAKLSDFGLAKLMTTGEQSHFLPTSRRGTMGYIAPETREQSHSFSTSLTYVQGTLGYIAPEQFLENHVSQKSDVYSYGILLLEIIGGRKNIDASYPCSDIFYFPSYAFKMLEEGKLKDIFDSKMRIDDVDERVSTAVMVALWCIQLDRTLRPPMTKVVQMLQGICSVPQPPIPRLYPNELPKGGTSSGPSDCNSDAYLSAESLSGPR